MTTTDGHPETLTRGECIADPYFVGAPRRDIQPVVALIPNEQRLAAAEPSRSNEERRAERKAQNAMTRAALRPRHLARMQNGAVLRDGDGRMYTRGRDGSLRRILIVPNGEGQPTAIGIRKSGKAQRKAEKRMLQRQRGNP